GAAQPIVRVGRSGSRRAKGRPVFILDLGAPRDFEPGVGEVDDNVFLYDSDDLEATCERNRQLRKEEVAKAQKMIGEETDRFMHDINRRATGPIVKRLREQWHDISRDELDLLNKKLAHLSDDDRTTVERSVERIVNKLLHPPLEALLKEAKGGAPHGLLDALKRLFHIPE
nr:glutamyl-tRNA reductase [Planctomycetota bacterium]